MERNISIEQMLDSMDKTTVRKSKKSPVFPVLLIVFGLICLIVNSSLSSINNSIIPPMLIIAGLGFVISGIFALLFRKSYYVSSKSKEKIKFLEIYFDVKEREKLISALKSCDVKAIKSLQTSNQDGLKLRLAYTSDGEICLSQVVNFIPYEYVNVTEVHTTNYNDTKMLFALAKV